MESTMAHNYPKGVTLDDVWAALRETNEQQKETARIVKENAKQMKETDRRMEKTRRENEEIGRRMGYLNNRFGELAEHLVAPGIVKKINDLGYKYDGVHSRRYIIHDKKGNIAAEIDILMKNGSSVMAVEVKTKPKIQDIKQHIKRMEILKKHLNKNNDKVNLP